MTKPNYDESQFNFTNTHYITKELQIANDRLSYNKNQYFQPPKDIRKLLKLLTFKNHKIHKERILKKVQHQGQHYLDLNNKLQTEKYVHNQMSTIWSPFWQKNMFASFQSNRNTSSNTVQLFQINDRIKRVAIQSKFLQRIYSKRNDQRIKPNVINKIETQEKKLGNMLSSIYISSLIEQIKPFYVKNTNVYEKNSLNGQRSIEQTSLQKKIDNTIIKYFQSKATVNELSQQLKSLANFQQKISNQKVFSLFICELSSIQASTKPKDRILPIQNHLLIHNYYLTYVDTSKKLSSYSNVRCRMLSQSKYSTCQYNLQNQEHLIFWCRLLMLFFCQELTQLELFNELNKNGHQYFVSSLKDFYQHGVVKNQQILKEKFNYQNNLFYRIFVKILLNEPFNDTESNTLYESQREIVTYLKLKFIPEFHRTMEFKSISERIVSEVKESIINKNIEAVSKLLAKLINYLAFDQIYFNFFASNGEYRLSNYQLLLILQILILNPNLLKYSVYSSQKWANDCVDILQSLIRKTNQQNTQNYTQIMIKVLTLCKKHIPKADLRQKVINLLSTNKLVLNKFISPGINYVGVILKKFGLELSLLEKAVLISIDKDEQYVQLIKEFISSYIKLDDSQFRQVIPLHKLMSYALKSQKHKDLSRSQEQCHSIAQIKNTFSLGQFVSKNYLFVFGFKLEIKLLFKLLVDETKSYSSDQLNNHLRRYKFISNKTRNLSKAINTLFSEQTSIFNKQLQLRPNKNSLSEEHELKKKESKMFIDKISSLLEISELLINFIELSKYFLEQDSQIISNVASYIQDSGSTEQGYPIKIYKFYQDLVKFHIVDKTFGFRLLSQFTEKLLKSLKILNPNRSRRINPVIKELNLSVIIEFVENCLKIILPFVEFEEQTSLNWKKETYDMYSRMF